MTGNKIAWRAPLAGLASLAMVATMGVAAGTASAADVEFTFKLPNTVATKFVKDKAQDGVSFKSDTEVTVKDQDADGKLGVAEATKADAALDTVKDGYTKTGWYDGTTPVAASGKADKNATATTVTAGIYADDDVYTVKVDSNAMPGGHNVKFGGRDKVAAWQLPEDTDKTDGNLLKGYAPAKQAFDGVIDFATVDLTQFATQGSKVVDLKSVNVASNWVKFVTPTGTADDAAWKIAPADDETAKAYTVEVEQNAQFSAYGQIPQAQNGSVMTSTFKQDPTDKDEAAFSADTTIVKDLTLEAVVKGATDYVTVTFDDSNATNAAAVDVKAQQIATGSTATKPTEKLVKDDNDNVKYGSYDWYEVKDGVTADKPFDFSSKINKDVTLKAVFTATEIRVGFDPAYGTEPVQYAWFKTGDKFQAPSITKDGKVAIFVGAPADGKVLTVKGETLTYLTSIDNKPSEGTVEHTIAAGTVFKADYESAEADTLTKLEGKVTDNKGYYTDASYKQYKADFETYLANKAAKGPDYTVSEYAELIKQLKGFQAELVEVADTPLYRVYNPNNGDHYYTNDRAEAANLVTLGWKREATTFRAISAKRADNALGKALYSAYNPNTGEHLLVEAGEAAALQNAGWIWETPDTPKFYTVQNGAKDVYRVYNPNTNGPAHHYAEQGEAAAAVSMGWKWDNGGNAVFQLS